MIYHKQNSTLKRDQSGAVLFVSMVILGILSILGIATLTNSNLELRMSGNAADRLNSVQAANGGLDEVFNFVLENPAAPENPFTRGQATYPVNDMNTYSSEYLSVEIDLHETRECPRSESANSNNVIRCRYLRLASTHNINGDGNAQTATHMGAIQPVPNLGN